MLRQWRVLDALIEAIVGRKAHTVDFRIRKVPMREPHVDDHVRLMHDIPELSLHRGAVGVVRSTWFAPATAYEVEFHQMGDDIQTRALLQPDQVQIEDGSQLISHTR